MQVTVVLGKYKPLQGWNNACQMMLYSIQEFIELFTQNEKVAMQFDCYFTNYYTKLNYVGT